MRGPSPRLPRTLLPILRLGLAVLLAVLLAEDREARAQGLVFAPEEQVAVEPAPGSETPAADPRDALYGSPRLPGDEGFAGPATPAGDGRDQTAAGGGPAADAGGLFAPPPPPPPEPPPAPPEPVLAASDDDSGEYVGDVMNYYMFKDDQGVTHLTDAPVDPRYRLFTIQITVTTGRAPFRRLNLDRVKPIILRASETYKVDPALITAIIKAESAFDPKAVSWVGAQGLMQLMPNTARLMGVDDSFDPQQNIMGGTRYIRMMLNRFDGDVTLAVAAYNCGPERVARAGAVPEIRETKNYVRTVLRNYELFLQLFASGE
ncbi:MAG: lytic transglycosylase domain-containing protein [Deltaproteobacteria bacterium]|jgi:hypothetical protein|nr:lytic transglycosylase domain-containing protein [Deltaproteobacteria bacterium]